MFMKSNLKVFVSALTLLSSSIYVVAESNVETNEPVADYSASIFANSSTGNFAPYFIGSLNHGKTVMKTSALLDVDVVRGLAKDRRFSWGFGGELVLGYSAKADYIKWDESSKDWVANPQAPAVVWLQQSYFEIKYRGVFLTAGMKERHSALLNEKLSSGDLVESGNSRPIPEVRTGFIDFQNIPFTNGWVQIQGEISYGFMFDNVYNQNHFNYYNYHINLNPLYSYKRCYFRTNPKQPFSVTVGMQVGSFFGGKTEYYSNGLLTRTSTFSKSLSTFLKMFLPIGETGEDYYTGSTLGSWDLFSRYRLNNNDEICAYFQWPWEDGSGIGKMNGWDGVWGLEYKFNKPGLISGAVIEYIDFRNQGGPIHWEPDDTPGTTITSHATGRDNYYNNVYYNSYVNYGMSIGTPFFLSPVYNLDGYPAFVCNRCYGFHCGLMGNPTNTVDYRVLVGYQKGLGNYTESFPSPKTNTSMLFEAGWDASKLSRGLSMRIQAAFDAGTLRGNNFGASLTLKYSGEIWQAN